MHGHTESYDIFFSGEQLSRLAEVELPTYTRYTALSLHLTDLRTFSDVFNVLPYCPKTDIVNMSRNYRLKSHGEAFTTFYVIRI